MVGPDHGSKKTRAQALCRNGDWQLEEGAGAGRDGRVSWRCELRQNAPRSVPVVLDAGEMRQDASNRRRLGRLRATIVYPRFDCKQGQEVPGPLGDRQQTAWCTLREVTKTGLWLELP